MVLGYNIFKQSIEAINLKNSKQVINTINPHSYCVAKKDIKFRKALQKSDILIPDGIGIVWAIKILIHKRIKRITGADLQSYLLNILNKKHGKIFYLGSSPLTLNKIKVRIKKEYPNIIFSCFSPPYKPEFTKEENNEIIDIINNFNPDVVFVGMTAPKQEKWSYNLKNELNVNIIASIGAAFDFYAGTVKRSNPLWIKFGLEWLPRLVREPKRLWRRNFVSTPCFIIDVLKFKLGILKTK